MRGTAALVLVLVAVLVLGLGAACNRSQSDAAIANAVKAGWFAETQLKAASLDVKVQDGEATITGDVPSDGARYLAFRLAADTPGVTKVHDQMTVKVAEAAVAPPPEPEPAPAPKLAPARKPAKKAAPVVREAPAAPAEPAVVPVAAAQPAAPREPEPPKPVEVEIPAGTPLVVRMIDEIDSEVHRSGEIFRASLDAPLMSDGEAVVPAGANVMVKLVESRSAGRVAGRSELRLELVRLEFQGKSYILSSSTYEQVGGSRGKRTAATVGGGAAIGAAIGAIAGGGKGAAIGAAIGAASGTAVQVATKGQQIRIPSETRLEFRLEAPLEITYTPGEAGPRRDRR